MSIYSLLYYQAQEELQALHQRKRANPNSPSIDAQIREMESQLERAKRHLK